jgi:DnaK suppressor protein
MTAAQRKAFEKRLKALEAELLERGPSRIEPNRTDAALPADAEDEQPLNEMLQAIASGRNRTYEADLQRIRKALMKLRDDPDMFGLCEQCEEPIAKARLEAQPHALLCVGCQSKKEDHRGGATRKKLTDYR